jgi:hypothetical protein
MDNLLRIILPFVLAATSASLAAAPISAPCEPKAVGAILSAGLGKAWNEGTARAWDENGEFWSMPIAGKLDQVEKILKEKLSSTCEVKIASNGSFTVRIIPLNVSKKTHSDLEAFTKTNTLPPLQKEPNLVSPDGATIGSFSPGHGELMLILYSAKIASAIARGRGASQQLDFPETAKALSFDLDLEYNFGDIAVIIVGGSGKMTMREATTTILRDVRKLGYEPLPNSESTIKSLDGLFLPDHHESFWSHSGGVIRIELEKEKNGMVHFNMHETKQIVRLPAAPNLKR